MTETFEHKGKWKLPESDTWFDGTLSFDPDNGAKLEIFGSFNSYFDSSNKEIVLGKTISGDVTLIDVWYRNTRSASNDIIVSIYEPIFIIDGHHFSSESDICFRHVISRVFNLFQWFDQSGFKDDIDYNNGNYEISYNKLTPLPFTLSDQCQGKVLFDSPVSYGNFYNERHLKEQAYFSLDYTEKMHYKTILKDLRYLTGFITLFTYEQSYPISITFRDEDYSEEISNIYHRPKYIKCIFQNSSYDSKYKLRRPHEHLLKYKEVTNKFPEIINKWYEMYNNHESVFTLMLYSFRRKNHFSVEKFMDTARALETFHRDTHNNERIPQEEYEKLVNTILKSVKLNNTDTDWLTNKLRGNEPSLSKRIKELIIENQNEFIKASILDKQKFSCDIANTRNYHTHYDKIGKEKALDDKSLFEATLKLMGLLYSVILRELGLNNSDFEKGLKYHLFK